MNIKLVFNWFPFAFCVLLVHQYAYVGTGSSSAAENWQYFSIWLTMCFFFVCAITYSMQKQIEILRAEVQALQKPDQH
jgi:hypothetical protein